MEARPPGPAPGYALGTMLAAGIDHPDPLSGGELSGVDAGGPVPGTTVPAAGTGDSAPGTTVPPAGPGSAPGTTVPPARSGSAPGTRVPPAELPSPSSDDMPPGDVSALSKDKPVSQPAQTRAPLAFRWPQRGQTISAIPERLILPQPLRYVHRSSQIKGSRCARCRRPETENRGAGIAITQQTDQNPAPTTIVPFKNGRSPCAGKLSD